MDPYPLTPETEPAPALPAEPAVPAALPSRTEQRIARRIDAGEEIRAWSRGWVSRDGRLHGLLAARILDFVVVTEHRLYLVSTGFFTRRPRRRVYDMPLDRLRIREMKPGRRRHLRVASLDHRPLRIDLKPKPASDSVADLLTARTAGSEVAPA